MRRILLIVFAGLILSGSFFNVAAAPIGWSVTSDADIERLYTIDLATGAASSVGYVGYDVEGLSFDPTTGILYGIDDEENALISMDTSTAAVTVIGSLGVYGFLNAGLAIDGYGNAFMAHQDGNDIYSVNLSTGSATLIGNTGLGDDGIDGLAFIGSTLYGVSTNNDTLYSIDTTNAIITAVGVGLGVDIESESGLAFDGTDLWAVDDSGDIFRIDPSTGVGTFIATSLEFEGLAILDSSATIPEPGTVLLFGLGMLVLAGTKIKK